MGRPPCWLAQFCRGVKCDGPMDRAHLVEQQRLKKEGHADLCRDPRTWKWACRRHHGMFDGFRRQMRVPRSAIPGELVVLLESIGLMWALERDRRYLARG